MTSIVLHGSWHSDISVILQIPVQAAASVRVKKELMCIGVTKNNLIVRFHV